MIRVLMHGCNGEMGHVVTQLCTEDPELTIVEGVSLETDIDMGYPVVSSCDQLSQEADVIIDFSGASAIDALLDYAVSKKLPLVLCSTGLSEAQLSKVEDAYQEIPVLKSANMSLGINLLMELVKKASSVLAPAGFDIEIVEKHHNQKLDAPSGTAVSLADSINEEMGGAYEYVYDRSDRRQKRDKKELGISAVRGGTIVGEHEIIFAGTDEVVTLQHTAYSRSIFAKGAVSAAKYLVGKAPGHYEMADVIRGV